MFVHEVATRHVVFVLGDVCLRDAAELMRKHHVGALVVVGPPNGERMPIGMLTDRDIVVSVVAAGASPESLTVTDVMSRPLFTCGQDDDLFEAVRVMRKCGVRRLPVLNRNGGVSGLLALDDVYRALGAHLNAIGDALTRELVREMEIRS